MNKLSPSIKKIASITGILLGAFALSAIASSSSWTEAPCTPPACNTAAPINVGQTDQTKVGRAAFDMVESDVQKANNRYVYSLETGGSIFSRGLIVSGKTITNELNVGTMEPVISKRNVNWNNDKAVLGNDGNGDAVWKDISTLVSSGGGNYHYIAPERKFDAGSTPIHMDTWTAVNYPDVTKIPTTAKSVIIRAYVQEQRASVPIVLFIRDGSVFPAQEVARADGTFGSDSVVLNLPYSSNRVFEVRWSSHGMTDDSGSNLWINSPDYPLAIDKATIDIIGYTD